jgi:hypothetical protein
LRMQINNIWIVALFVVLPICFHAKKKIDLAPKWRFTDPAETVPIFSVFPMGGILA